MDKDKSKRLASATINLGSYYGMYGAIRLAWKAMEKAELGYEIETVADTIACSILTLIIWFALRVIAD